MPNLWSLITGPIFKFILILLVGVILGWFVSDMLVVNRLQGKVYGLQETVAELKAEVQSAKLATRSAYDAVNAAEEQCKGLIEHERSKPRTEIKTDVDVDDDYLGRVFDGVRSDGKSSNPSGPAGSRNDPKARSAPKR